MAILWKGTENSDFWLTELIEIHVKFSTYELYSTYLFTLLVIKLIESLWKSLEGL